MATTVGAATITASLVIPQTVTPTNQLAAYAGVINEVLTRSFGAGTGAGKINKVLCKQTKALAGGATDQYDIVGGGLTDYAGNSIDMTKVKGILLANQSVTAAVISLGGGTDGAGNHALAGHLGNANDLIKLAPGAFVFYCVGTADGNGIAAAGGSTDVIAVIGDAALAAVYDLIVFGE